MFIIIEFILNLTVSVDFGFRVRMQGFKKYLHKTIWNKLDFVIVCCCNILFLISLISDAVFEEMSEEILLVAWSIGQSLRMLVIARK